MPAAELCVVVADAWPDPTAPLYGALRLAAGTCMSRAADWKRANVQFARIEHDPVVGREARALLAHGARNLGRRDEAAARLAAIESEPGVPTPVVAARLAFLRGLLASDSQEIETSCRHLREAVAHWKLAMVLALALARQGDAAGRSEEHTS